MTNQASEDELERKIEQCFIKNNMCDCGDEHTSLSLDETEFFDVEAVVKDIKQLIRTEKLMLLAEVRERVVGENIKWNYTERMQYSTRETDALDYMFAVNSTKDEQRDLLTKLEAEL